MSPQTVFVFSIPIFVLALTLPVIILSCVAFFKNINRLTGKQAMLTWACIICYYVVFFTQVPKVTRPYFAQNSHQVTECTTRQVFNQ